MSKRQPSRSATAADPADHVVGFEDRGVFARLGQLEGGGEAGRAGSDDHDIVGWVGQRRVQITLLLEGCSRRAGELGHHLAAGRDGPSGSVHSYGETDQRLVLVVRGG